MNKAITIPYWESDEGKRDVLKKCITSFGKEKVIVLTGRQKTLPTAWNMCLDIGFSMADYVILSNDDVILDKGKLDYLCQKDKVVSPTVNDEVFKIFHAHIFGIPKNIYEKVGGFDESFNVYWSDTDYALRLKKANISTIIDTRVNVLHPEPARTIKKVSHLEQQDKQTFLEKHGQLWFDPIRDIKL